MIKRTTKTVTEEFDEQGRLRWRTTDDIVEEEVEETTGMAEADVEEIEVPMYLSFDEDNYEDCAHYLNQLASCDISKCNESNTTSGCECGECAIDTTCSCCSDDVAIHIYLHVDGANVHG